MTERIDFKAIQALSEEAGGLALKEYCELMRSRAEKEWLKEIDPNSEKVPNERTLLLKQIKYQADMGAYRRVIGLLTAPKETENE
jgi:hypothetical protein